MSPTRHSNLMLPTRGQPGIVSEGVIHETGLVTPNTANGDVLEIIGITSHDPGDGYGARDYLLLHAQGGTTSTATFSNNPSYRIAGVAVTASAVGNQPEVIEFIKCGLATNLHINDAGGVNHGQAIEASTVQRGTGEGAAVETNKVFAVGMEDSPGATPSETRSFVLYWRG